MILQYAIIFLITYLGEIISRFISIPVPGTVIGMFILFIGLWTRIIKVDHISDAVNILLINMAVFFIPPGVKLLSSLSYLEGFWIKIMILMSVTTIITMVVTGRVVQYCIRRGEKDGDK